MARDQPMDGMERTPPPQVGCTDKQMLQLDAIRRGFARVEAQMLKIRGDFDELIAAINALAGHVSNIRRLRAERLGAPDAGLVALVQQVELIFGEVAAQVRRGQAIRDSMVDMARSGLGLGGGGSGGAADALVAGLERICLDLCLEAAAV